MSTSIHPTAIVSSKASLGINVSIGPYAIIDAEVTIGDNTIIEAHTRVQSMTSLGSNNHIHSFATIGGPPQDLKYKGEKTTLSIGNNNCIREYVTIHRGTQDGSGTTRIDSNCLLMAYAHVAHDCHLEDQVILANAATLAGHVHIEKKAVIGGLSAVHQFVRIGQYAYIGGMTGIAQDVPPYTLIAGERGRLYGINIIGLKRQGFTQTQVSGLKQAFKLIWRSGLRREEAIEHIQQNLGNSPEVMHLIQFVQTSRRGIAGPKLVKKNK
jgi:UDP-N-acetylglucosamine acyltransferase